MTSNTRALLVNTTALFAIFRRARSVFTLPESKRRTETRAKPPRASLAQ